MDKHTFLSSKINSLKVGGSVSVSVDFIQSMFGTTWTNAGGMRTWLENFEHWVRLHRADVALREEAQTFVITKQLNGNG